MEPTAFQAECLAIIDRLNVAVFNHWFSRSSVMATIQVESAFRPQATRYEPALREASYGLMQVLESTARDNGMEGQPNQMFYPETSIRFGMWVHRRDWDALTQRFGREPTTEEWCDAYNRGCHGGMLGSYDHAYVRLWMHAKDIWREYDIPEVPAVAPPPSEAAA